MSCVFEELSRESFYAHKLRTTTFEHHVTCHNCLQIMENEELMSTLPSQIKSIEQNPATSVWKLKNQLNQTLFFVFFYES